MDFFAALNCYDFLNQYCSNLLKNPTVRGLRNSKELHAVWINSCTKDVRHKMAVLSMYAHCLYVQSQNHEEKNISDSHKCNMHLRSFIERTIFSSKSS